MSLLSQLSRNDLRVLSNIHPRDGADALELTSLCGLTQPTVARRALVLAEAGLIVLRDTGSVERYELTDAGIEAQRQLNAAV